MKPIFIVGCHKSGTSLLRSLLDGHKDLFVIPIESHFFQKVKMWVDYRFKRTFPEEHTRDELINNFVEWINYCNNSYDPYADSITLDKWNVEKFKWYLKNASFDNYKDLFDKYVEAMYYSLYGEKLNNCQGFVEKSVENAEFAWILRAMYPNSKFIHIVRNPYSTMVAIRKFKTNKNKYPYMRDIICSMYNSYYYLFKNKRFLNNYLVVKYEDLVIDSQKWINNIFNFLNISYDNILNYPTQFGLNWNGNSTSGEKFYGISASQVDSWKNEINNFEVQLVNKYFAHVLKEYYYEPLISKGSLFKPIKGESMKKYMANRCLFYLF